MELSATLIFCRNFVRNFDIERSKTKRKIPVNFVSEVSLFHSKIDLIFFWFFVFYAWNQIFHVLLTLAVEILVSTTQIYVSTLLTRP